MYLLTVLQGEEDGVTTKDVHDMLAFYSLLSEQPGALQRYTGPWFLYNNDIESSLGARLNQDIPITAQTPYSILQYSANKYRVM